VLFGHVRIDLNPGQAVRVTGTKVISLVTLDGSFVQSSGEHAAAGDDGTLGKYLLYITFSDGTVALRNLDGHYLSFDSQGLVHAKPQSIGISERFEPVWTDGQVALRTHEGSFIRAENGGHDELNTHTTVDGVWAKMTLIEQSAYKPKINRTAYVHPSAEDIALLGPNTGPAIPIHLMTDRDLWYTRLIRFVGSNGKYVRARADGSWVKADSTQAGDDELFMMIRFTDGTCALRSSDGGFVLLRSCFFAEREDFRHNQA